MVQESSTDVILLSSRAPRFVDKFLRCREAAAETGKPVIVTHGRSLRRGRARRRLPPPPEWPAVGGLLTRCSTNYGLHRPPTILDEAVNHRGPLADDEPEAEGDQGRRADGFRRAAYGPPTGVDERACRLQELSQVFQARSRSCLPSYGAARNSDRRHGAGRVNTRAAGRA